MIIKILEKEKFAITPSEYDYEWQIFLFKLGKFKIDWFTDYGGWFIYISIGDKYVRFSSVGFMYRR